MAGNPHLVQISIVSRRFHQGQVIGRCLALSAIVLIVSRRQASQIMAPASNHNDEVDPIAGRQQQ